MQWIGPDLASRTLDVFPGPLIRGCKRPAVLGSLNSGVPGDWSFWRKLAEWGLTQDPFEDEKKGKEDQDWARVTFFVFFFFSAQRGIIPTTYYIVLKCHTDKSGVCRRPAVALASPFPVLSNLERLNSLLHQ